MAGILSRRDELKSDLCPVFFAFYNVLSCYIAHRYYRWNPQENIQNKFDLVGSTT